MHGSVEINERVEGNGSGWKLISIQGQIKHQQIKHPIASGFYFQKVLTIDVQAGL
jgi:hypothetical protein